MNHTQRRIGFLAVVAVAAIVLPGCSSNRPKEAQRKQIEHESVVTVTAIDVPNRLVTVRGAEGDSLTVYVDESNKAFPQAKVNDRVRIRYTESIAVQLKKPGEAGVGLAMTEETSHIGPGRPAGKTASEVKATVRIESVDKKGSVVTFTGPRGRRTVHVKDPGMRDYVKMLKEGDNVEVTYSEALALTLEPVRGG